MHIYRTEKYLVLEHFALQYNDLKAGCYESQGAIDWRWFAEMN